MHSYVPLLICAVLALTLPATAGIVIDVPDDQPTIAAGLAAASPGDTVRVACDTYYEHGLSMPSGVTLMSASLDPSCVTIDGEATDSIFECYSITGAVVAGITFTNGAATWGGAVRCNDATVTLDGCVFTGNEAGHGAGIHWVGGTPEITGCDFSDNTGTGSGGALALAQTDGSVTDCTFTGNEARWGGALYTYFDPTTTVFTDCDFVGNTATSATAISGGAILCQEEASPTFASCYFEGNSAYGGGAFVSQEAAPTFTGCEFHANTSEDLGGAGVCTGDQSVFEDCEFVSNTVTWYTGGGALHFRSSSTATLEDCVFYRNYAYQGGGILAAFDCAISVTGCTFAQNEVAQGGHGGGIHVSENADVTLHGTIIAFSVVGEAVACGATGTATLTCCDVFGNEGGDWVDCIEGQEVSGDNLAADPLLCGVEDEDLTLCANSPCLPGNNNCGELIGAYDEGCPECDSPVELMGWGVIKGMFR